MGGDRTTELEQCIRRLNEGEEAARESLIELAAGRLRALVHDMLVGDTVHPWEETDDVLQEALVQLERSLRDVRPSSVRAFLQLAAFHIRRVLNGLARHYYGPQGMAANQASHVHDLKMNLGSGMNLAAQDNTPSRIAVQTEEWLRLHEAVDRLPDEEREITEILWFHGLKQAEAAMILEIAERTVRRRWQRARLMLYEVLNEDGEGRRRE